MKHTLLKTALVASAATLLMAAGPKADLNQDGQVTKAEFMQAAQTNFAAADTNGDGFLGEDERKALRAAKQAERKDKMFNKLDADGDGSVTRAEMEAVGEKMKARKAEMDARKQEFMEKYDTNLDGELSDAEKTVMKAERESKFGERTGNYGDRAGKKDGKRGRRGQRPNPDANGDGVISLDEQLAVSEQLFTRLDANADGVLTEGEGKQRRGRRGGKRGG